MDGRETPRARRILTVPGWGGSGPGHWQTRWEASVPGMSRVEQDDWLQPERSAWVERLCREVDSSPAPVVLVGHSLGCGAIVHAAAQGRLGRVAGAFLVAMPDMERPGFPEQIRGFSPVPRLELPFAAWMVGSRDDPFIGIDRLREWAGVLGAEFVDVGARHHIGDAANLGEWREGRDLFEAFLESLDRSSSGRGNPYRAML